MSTLIKAPGRHLVVPGLPDLYAFRAVFRAADSGLLPPLPTTAVHGALGRALHGEACVAASRPSCRECPAAAGCPYSRLFEPRAPGGETAAAPAQSLPGGVNEDLPRPLAIAPDLPLPAPDGQPLPVADGERIAFRLVFVGSDVNFLDAVLPSLHRMGLTGLGSRPEGPGRVHLRFEGLEELLPAADPGPAPADVRLTLLTPLRLKTGGSIARTLDGPALVFALVRRARALAGLYGDPWEPAFDPREVGEALEVRAAVHGTGVTRYSSRQGQTIRWDGITGTASVGGPSLPVIWPLLRFGEWAQIGKGTTFGLGLYRLDGREGSRN